MTEEETVDLYLQFAPNLFKQFGYTPRISGQVKVFSDKNRYPTVRKVLTDISGKRLSPVTDPDLLKKLSSEVGFTFEDWKYGTTQYWSDE